MTEKIIVSPQRVRCLGDVVSPKAVSDFDKVSCTLSSSSDTVYGTVYSESYLAGSTLSLVYDGLIGSETESFTVSATLKDSGGSAITSVTVYCSVNGGSAVSATTDSSGVATFTISTTEGVSEYKFRVYYEGTGSVCGSYAYGCVRVGDVTGLTLNGSPSVIQSGDKSNIWAKLTGTGNLQGALVKFYEAWTPGIRLSADKSIIQSGDTVDFTAQLVDSDGSLVREAGHTVNFYIDSSILFEFDNTNDKSSSFTSQSCESGTNGTITYDSSTGINFVSGSKATMFAITSVALPTNCTIEADLNISAGTAGIGITKGTGYVDGLVRDANKINNYRYTNSSWDSSFAGTTAYGDATINPITLQLVKTGLDISLLVNGVQIDKTLQFASTDTLYAGVIGNASMNAYLTRFVINGE